MNLLAPWVPVNRPWKSSYTGGYCYTVSSGIEMLVAATASAETRSFKGQTHEPGR